MEMLSGGTAARCQTRGKILARLVPHSPAALRLTANVNELEALKR